MRHAPLNLMLNVELGLRQKSKELFPFHFSFLIFKTLSFLICHLSFVISHFFFSVNESEIHA